jgi:class 3 adenylate cyclase
MFVDVSGFTLLGEQLRAAHGPVQGGALLAERITLVISQLATLCLDFGGDVSKFAGDALLCVWEGGTEEQMLNVACECAVAMLGMMREQKAKTGSMLEIHGGLGGCCRLVVR